MRGKPRLFRARRIAPTAQTPCVGYDAAQYAGNDADGHGAARGLNNLNDAAHSLVGQSGCKALGLSGLPQTNSYAYVANNPIGNRDPSGLSIIPPSKPVPPRKPEQPECPTGNDLYNKCVEQCKRAFAGYPTAIARCVWIYCRKYL